jgi:hypothetical protein
MKDSMTVVATTTFVVPLALRKEGTQQLHMSGFLAATFFIPRRTAEGRSVRSLSNSPARLLG